MALAAEENGLHYRRVCWRKERYDREGSRTGRWDWLVDFCFEREMLLVVENVDTLIEDIRLKNMQQWI